MSNLENRISEIEERLEEIKRNIITLQDMILYMKTALETVTSREVEKECLARLTLKTNENMDKFLKERSSECSIQDWCTRRVEKATSMILRAFMEQGTRSAIELAKYSVDAATRHYTEINCTDQNCFKNAIDTFKTLEELLETSKEVSVKFTKDLYSPKRWSDFEEIREEEICELLAPLSNVTRLRILKSLGKGGRNYAQLERQIGIKGGHLQFHLNNLIQADYVTQEKPQGKYLITMKGLKALRFSYGLKELVGENRGSPSMSGIMRSV
ncbi:MAG: winged helix-turn-helix domain-containing protein [Candidatus Lokiarchaeia archaeon]